MIGTLPQSTALAEAQGDSVGEAIDRYDRHISAGTIRSPEARRDLARIVTEMRQQRERWEAAEAATPVRRARGAPPVRKLERSIEDLDL